MKKSDGFNYFLSPQGYFWKWADAGRIIEWQNDRTICYTEDLANVIRLLKDTGVPSLGTILLVLAACNDGWLVNESCKETLYDLANSIPASQDESDNDVMNHYVHQAITGMDRIAQLPADLRKGFQRSHILHEIVTAEFIVVESDEVLSMADETGSFQLAEFNVRGRFYLRSQSTADITRSQFLSDLKCLAQVAEKYPDAQRLERKLRTGLPAIPLPAPIELPEEKKQGNLLQQLLEEPKTTHISQLAKRMIAALHIPMHFQRSGGASYGGVSDITNRGNFDKLLLSELAADNTLLLTRLVHNEALYLRREEPPNNPKTRRLILLDTTIRLWGTPRVFAVSAAIACTQNLRPNESVEAYTLGGKSFAETDMATTEGVLKTLEHLDAALHCTNGLSTCIDEVGTNGQSDTIFITGAEMIMEPSFQKWLATVGEALDFIITVNGDGELHFSSVSAGRLKHLSSAKIDLEEVLAEKKLVILPKRQKGDIERLPAFFALERPPLLFPALHTKKKERNRYHFYHETIGLFGITETQRLLNWAYKNKGATEWLLNVPEGKPYHFFYDDEFSICLMVSHEGAGTADCYYINTQSKEVRHHQLKIPGAVNFYSGFLKGDTLYALVKPYHHNNDAIAVIDIRYGTVNKRCSWEDCQQAVGISTAAPPYYDSDTANKTPLGIGKFINNGYTVLIRIKTIFIDAEDRLCLNTSCFKKPSDSHNFILLGDGVKAEKMPATHKSEEIPLKTNERLWLKQFSWKDGSTATVDSRGLLHLKSSNTALPEVTLILVQDKATACWASDGALCGNEYFRESLIGMTPVQHFYTKYITPFIQTILQKA